MNKQVDRFESESWDKPEDDNFEIEAGEPQQMRPEDFSGPWRGTVKDVQKKHFNWGERFIVLFEETDDYLLLHDNNVAAIKREIGSARRHDWRGAVFEIIPSTYKDKKTGETKHIFGVRVIKAAIPKAEEPVETPPPPDEDAPPFDDEITY